MAAESSTPRASRIEIVPRWGKETSCQRKIRAGTLLFFGNSIGAKSACIICGIDIALDPMKRKRGDRCCRNNCFSGVSSLRTAFRIREGNLPARPSSRSTIWRSDGGFTNVARFRLWNLSVWTFSWSKINCRTQMFRHIEIRAFNLNLKI